MRARTILREALSAAATLRGEAQPTREELKRRVKKLLDDVQLDESVLPQKSHTLSGGQRQRLSIARALALQPRILVCDESLSALDEDVRDEIVKLLKRLTTETGLALVFISHDVQLIAQISDEIMVFHRGEVIESASADEVLHHPAHPFTAELLHESGFWANPNTSA
jgi:peptide/nickel transport system ATP-binding protein